MLAVGATDFVCFKYGNDMRVNAYYNHPAVGSYSASPLTDRNYGITGATVNIQDNVMTCEFVVVANYLYRVST